MQRLKKRTFEILEAGEAGDPLAKTFDLFLMALILANVIVVMLQTVESLAAQYAAFFRIFTIISFMVFSAEYVLRIWSCTSSAKFRRPVSGRVRFALTSLALVDLASILPFYLPFLIPADLRVLRLVRVFWLFRLFKADRYVGSLGLLGNVLRKRKEELFIALFVGFLLLVISSSLMYFAEHGAQPEKFSSIPEAMWWGVQTLTTLGYGDVVPITPLGQLLGGIVAVLGIGMFALPAGILGSGLVDEIREQRVQREGGVKTCPHCGQPLDEPSQEQG